MLRPTIWRTSIGLDDFTSTHTPRSARQNNFPPFPALTDLHPHHAFISPSRATAHFAVSPQECPHSRQSPSGKGPPAGHLRTTTSPPPSSSTTCVSPPGCPRATASASLLAGISSPLPHLTNSPGPWGPLLSPVLLLVLLRLGVYADYGDVSLLR